VTLVQKQQIARRRSNVSHAEENSISPLHARTGRPQKRQRLENAFAHLSYLKARNFRPPAAQVDRNPGELEYVSGIAWHVFGSRHRKMSDEQVSQTGRRVHDLTMR